MSLKRLAVILGVTMAATAISPSAGAQSGYDLVEACLANGGSPELCRGLLQLIRVPGGICRDASDDHPECKRIDGIEIREELVAAHETSWLGRALALQRGLDDNRPLHDETWVHTHNSYNADAYEPTLYGQDRNHIYTVRDQLRMGTRAIELDLHWFPSTTTLGSYDVLVCHGNESILEESPVPVHVGCGVNDPLLGEYLGEIRAWLDANPDEVALIYLENALDDDPEAHDRAASEIEKYLGDLVHRPARSCAPLPMGDSRAEIRDAGARVLLAGNCGTGGAWGDLVHVRGPHWDEGGLDYGDDVAPYPCADEYVAEPTDFIRRWGDETGVSAGAGVGGDVTVSDAHNMVRCNVNMPGLDNLVPFDERLEQFVWSWAPDEPSTTQDGYCASQEQDGRFYARDCSVTEDVVKIKKKGRKGKRHVKKVVVEKFLAQPFACLVGGNWRVTTTSDRFSNGDEACAEIGGTFSVPWSGYENERLKVARPPDATGVWLNYRASGGRWTL